MPRLGRLRLLQEYYLGAALCHRKFGGPEPHGQDVIDLHHGVPFSGIPQGRDEARLAGFFWQVTRIADLAETIPPSGATSS